jgi:prophage DNA circulation protein
VSTGNIRALAFLAVGLMVILIFRAVESAPPSVVSTAESQDVLQARLARLRQTAATVPARAAVLRSVDNQLQNRETGMLHFDTAAQAQAHLLEVIRRLATSEKIQALGGDLSAPAQFGANYGQVAVTVNFETTIESFVNFLADLSKEPELIAPAEMHIAAGNQKSKTINVRITVAGVVSRKLVPEHKTGLAL